MNKLLTLTLIVAFGCSRNNTRDELVNEAANANTKDGSVLTGNWTRYEELRDPGNGSGQWIPVPSSAQSRVSFGADGRLSTNNYSHLASFNRYRVVAPGEVHFYSTADSLTAYYITDGKQLQLNFEAREPMQDRFLPE